MKRLFGSLVLLCLLSVAVLADGGNVPTPPADPPPSGSTTTASTSPVAAIALAILIALGIK